MTSSEGSGVSGEGDGHSGMEVGRARTARRPTRKVAAWARTMVARGVEAGGGSKARVNLGIIRWCVAGCESLPASFSSLLPPMPPWMPAVKWTGGVPNQAVAVGKRVVGRRVIRVVGRFSLES